MTITQFFLPLKGKILPWQELRLKKFKKKKWQKKLKKKNGKKNFFNFFAIYFNGIKKYKNKL